MSHDKWDDAMFCHGSLIGYMAGVKAACKDEDRLDLLLAMVKTQAKLEDVERENAKLQKQSEQLFDKTLELATENRKLRELCKLCEREAENTKLRQMVARMWPMATGTKRCTFADRLKLRAEIDELGIEVQE